ncbi:MAG TPA: hypothetical protein PK466_14830, partial [Thermotogota bacterium]|nr:hypothetical protein [Thermotogota bacterium]
MDEQAIERLRTTISSIHCEQLEFGQVNYYHFDENVILYDTDSPSDIGLDLSDTPEMIEFFTSMQPGEVKSPGMILEYNSDRLRLFTTIRLADGSWFTVGVLFNNLYDKFLEISRDFFSTPGSTVTFLFNPDEKEAAYLSAANRTGEPAFHHSGITSGQYYISKSLPYGELNFVVEIRFIYGVELVVALLIMGAILTITSLFVKKILRRYGVEITRSIDVINNNNDVITVELID